MIEAPRGLRHESDVLIRQLDGHLASLRASRDHVDVALAERVAGALRRLVTETTSASAADRARVRAAVHYFVLRRDGRTGDRRPARALTEDVRVVNDIMHALNRHDLQVRLTPELA
jgi:hypothetical protein